MIWLAGAIWLVAVLLATLNVAFGALLPGFFSSFGTSEATGLALLATVGLVGTGYSTAGLLILRQRVRHAVGWLLLLAGPLILIVFSFIGFGYELAERGHPLAPWLILLASYAWVPAILLAGPVLALLFPDGRLPSPRWRFAIWMVVAVLVLTFVFVVFQPGSLDPENNLPDNPLGLAVLPSWLFDVLEVTGLVAIPAVLLLGAWAVVVRYRRSRGDERQQLKWYTFAVVVWALTLPPSLFIESDEFFIIAFGTLLLVPAAVLIAISRYRLYEIDTLINRTLVYVPLVGIVAGLYAASVVLFQRIFVAATGNTSDAAAIISALILAAVFTPIRKSLEGFVDRRFKPAQAVAPTVPVGSPWDDRRFEAAVERVVLRVLREQASSAGR